MLSVKKRRKEGVYHESSEEVKFVLDLNQEWEWTGVKVRKGVLGLRLVLFKSRLLDARLNMSPQCEVTTKKASVIYVALMKA